MLNMTVPKTGQVVSGRHWGGWTWLTKLPNLRVVRYLLYCERGKDVFQLVFFFREEFYEQFKDDLDYMGDVKQDAIVNGFTNGLSERSLYDQRSDGSIEGHAQAGS